MSNIKTQIGKVIGKTLNSYHARVKPMIDDLKFKEQYQGRIIDCMVGEIDDNYIETPETDSAIVKLEHSKEGLVKVPSIKGKTILLDADGNETDTPAEGCKLVSVGEDEDNKLIILSKNKNLVNKENIIKGATHYGIAYNIFKDEIGYINGNGIMFKECIKVKPNTDYFVQYGSDKRLHFIQYDINGDHIIGEYPVIKNGIYHTSENVHYINLVVAGGLSGDYDFNGLIKILQSTFMIEETSVNNPYVEQKSHKTEILLDEPLRSLPNGVCDEIVGNKLIRRVGKIVVNGSESWADIGDLQKTSRFLCRGYVQASSGDTINRNLCNNFPTIPFSERTIDSPYAYTHIDEVVIRINKSTINNKGKEGFLEYLKINPTEILYELAEPVIIEMPNTLTLQGFDDTTMYIENSITPTISYGYNALIPYKEELSKQKEEVETNTLDIENNIIPYLMDMEFNLMLMEDN